MIFDLPAHHSSVTEMRRMSSNGCLRLWYLTEWYLIIYRPWERQRMLTITTQNDIWSTCSPLLGDRDEEDEQQQMLTITILNRMIFDHIPPMRAAADAYDYDTELYLIYLLTTHWWQRWGGWAAADAYDYNTWQNDIWSSTAHESGSGCLRLRHRMILFDLPAHHSSATEMRRRSGSRCLRLWHLTEWYLIIYCPWERQRMLMITTQNDISWSTCSQLIGDRDEEEEQQRMLTITTLDRMILIIYCPWVAGSGVEGWLNCDSQASCFLQQSSTVCPSNQIEWNKECRQIKIGFIFGGASTTWEVEQQWMLIRQREWMHLRMRHWCLEKVHKGARLKRGFFAVYLCYMDSGVLHLAPHIMWLRYEHFRHTLVCRRVQS